MRAERNARRQLFAQQSRSMATVDVAIRDALNMVRGAAYDCHWSEMCFVLARWVNLATCSALLPAQFGTARSRTPPPPCHGTRI